MIFSTQNIQIDGAGFGNLRRYIRECLDEVKAGSITPEEFVTNIESCFCLESPLSWDNVVLLRSVCKE